MEEFWNAIYEKLVTSPTIVLATEYSPTNLTISRYPEDKLAETIGLYFKEVDSIVWGGSDVNNLQETDVDFYAVGQTARKSAEIAKTLLDQYINNDITQAFMDISNDDIRCHISIWDGQGPVTKDEDSDLYICKIGIVFRWSYK